MVLQRGCFKYFERGGNCVRGPVSLLSGSVSAYFSYNEYTIIVCPLQHYTVASAISKPFLLRRILFNMGYVHTSSHSLVSLSLWPTEDSLRRCQNGRVSGPVAQEFVSCAYFMSVFRVLLIYVVVLDCVCRIWAFAVE